MRVQPQPGSDSPLPLTGPLTVGDLLDRAFRLYRSRFGLFLLTGAVLIAPIAIVSGIFLARFFANYMQTLDMLMREPPPEFGPFAFFSALSGDFAGVTLIGLLLAAAGAIVSLSLTAQAAEALRDGSLSLMAGLRRGVRRFLPYVGMAIVQFAALAAAAVVVLAPLVLFGVALVARGAPFARAGEGGIFAALGIAGLAVGGFSLAFVLVLAPTTYLAARWLVAPAVLVVEEAGPIDALRRSWRLSQDNVLRMVGYLVLLYILEMIFISVPMVALQYATMLMPSSTGAIGLMMSLSTISSSLISVIGLPFFAAAAVLLYYDLRIRGSGYALKP
jgi:hypothetical protein